MAVKGDTILKNIISRKIPRIYFEGADNFFFAEVGQTVKVWVKDPYNQEAYDLIQLSTVVPSVAVSPFEYELTPDEVGTFGIFLTIVDTQKTFSLRSRTIILKVN